MQLFTSKTIPWIIGVTALLALISLFPGILLNATESPDAAPAMVESIEPALPASKDRAMDLEAVLAPAVPAPIVVDSLTAVSHSAIPQRVSSQAAPATVSISPEEDWNPIKSQHTFTITVNEEGGAPASGVEVELILNRFGEAVGDIVSVGGENPRKVDNTFGRVTTDGDGQATLTITATRVGDTDVTAYVPAIEDADAHKVFAVKHWVDLKADFPGDASNLVGTDHPIAVRVTRVSDDAPLANVEVLYTITDNDPAAKINDSSDASVVANTDADGWSRVVLRQDEPITGDNQVAIEIRHESGATLNHTITKDWQAPSLAVDKSGPDNLGLLKDGEYAVTVTNNGNTTASGVVLTDELPEGLTFISSTPPADSAEGSLVTWQLGDIGPEESVTITMALSATAVGEQVNLARVFSSEGFTGEDELLTDVIAGSLALTKTASAEVNLGDVIDYEITVTNDGQGALTNVVINDTPAAGTALTPADAPAQWTVALLDAGSTETFNFSATARETGSLTNTVEASSNEGATASAEATTLVVTSDVTVAKTVNLAEVLLGRTAEYTITVTNNGDGDATGVSVVDSMPEGLEVVSSEPTASVGNAGTLEWTIDALPAGRSTIFTVRARTVAGGTHTNTVTVTDRGFADTAQAQVTALTPSISLDKTGSAGVYIGGQREYTITATNNGEADLTGVTITDTIPAGMSFVSADSDGVASDAGDTVTWNIGGLAVGASAAVNVTLQGKAAGEVTNQASATSNEGAEATASFDITILPTPGASLSIVDSSDPLAVGEEGAYNITVLNQSEDSPITNVQVTVTIPSELEIIRSEGAEVAGNQVTFGIIASLASEQEQVFTIAVRAVEAGDVVAKATMTYAEFSLPVSADEGTTIINK